MGGWTWGGIECQKVWGFHVQMKLSLRWHLHSHSPLPRPPPPKCRIFSKARMCAKEGEKNTIGQLDSHLTQMKELYPSDIDLFLLFCLHFLDFSINYRVAQRVKLTIFGGPRGGGIEFVPGSVMRKEEEMSDKVLIRRRGIFTWLGKRGGKGREGGGASNGYVGL